MDDLEALRGLRARAERLEAERDAAESLLVRFAAARHHENDYACSPADCDLTRARNDTRLHLDERGIAWRRT